MDNKTVPAYLIKTEPDQIHLEYSEDRKEVEVYVSSFYLCSIEIEDLSTEMKDILGLETSEK